LCSQQNNSFQIDELKVLVEKLKLSVKKNCKFVSSELWIFSNSIFVLFLIYSNLWLGEQIKSQNISIKRNLMFEIKQCAVFGNFQFSLYF
jgi:hypothetical protein